MSPHIADEASIRIDWSAFTTVGNIMPPRANAALEFPGVKERLSELGATATPGSPAQFKAFIAHETEIYATAIRSAGTSVRR
jgi:hypothetical protein